MRSFAQLVDEPGGKDGNKEGDPKDGANEVQPHAERAARHDPRRHHQSEAKPPAERALGVGQRQQEASDAADQGRAHFTAQNPHQDRQPDIDEEQHPAAQLEIAP
jgi:hypothetical protein